MSPVRRQNRYRCTRTSGHFEGLVEGRIVLHCLQIGGAQSKLFLLAALGVIFGIVLGVILGVILEVIVAVLRRVVLDVVTLFNSAAHVGWTHTSSGSDPATAVFAKMSCRFNVNQTTARTKYCHELRDTPQIVVCVEWPYRSFQFLLIHYKASHERVSF